VADALARALTAAGVHVTREVGVEGKRRPADLQLRGFVDPRRLAIDVTVRHPLGAFEDPAAVAGTLAEAERQKHAKYDAVCARAGMQFGAFALSTFSGVGSEGLDLLHALQKRLEEAHGGEEGLAREAVERVGVACARGVGAQLLAALQGQLPEVLAAGEPRDPEAEDGEQASSWASWASQHGFVPSAPSGVPGSLGIRIVGARVWAW
jgi:hypothetical protein